MYHIVGVRDGDRLILETSSNPVRVAQRAEMYRRQLDDYESVTIEEESSSPGEKTMIAAPTAPANGQTMILTWEQMNRLQKSAAMKQLVKDLGPDSAWPQVRAAAAQRGWQPTQAMYWRCRSVSGFPKRPRGRPAAVSPAAYDRRAAMPQKPAHDGRAKSVPPDPSLEGLMDLALAVDKLGGIDQARKALECLETIGECLSGR